MCDLLGALLSETLMFYPGRLKKPAPVVALVAWQVFHFFFWYHGRAVTP